MRYRPTIKTTYDDIGRIAATAHRGQWIDLEGAQGRVAGVRNGCVWIAWSGTARKRFRLFCQAFKAN